MKPIMLSSLRRGTLLVVIVLALLVISRVVVARTQLIRNHKEDVVHAFKCNKYRTRAFLVTG
jgi:hypothetical protein